MDRTGEVILPLVDPAIWTKFPDYRALSVVARNFSLNGEPPAVPAASPAAWLPEHIEAWRAAFRAFGANPKKTSSSVEALWKRFEKQGSLPKIHPVVDLYNALSIRFGAPFGGEDLDHYAGIPRLVPAEGNETFDTARDGVPIVERPDPGEIIWRDDIGVTCRRWNWRQCRWTAIVDGSRNLWFVIDRLAPMPIDELRAAGDALITGLRALSQASFARRPSWSLDQGIRVPHYSLWRRAISLSAFLRTWFAEPPSMRLNMAPR